MNPDDILIEIEDRLDAETIHHALTEAARAEYQTAAQATRAANKALADYHFTEALRIERIEARFADVLYPDAEPEEYEPPLAKDDGALRDYDARELVQIRSQGALA